MVGIGDTDVGGRARLDIGDNVVIDIVVIYEVLYGNVNVWIVALEALDSSLVYSSLTTIVFIFRPKDDFILLIRVESRGDLNLSFPMVVELARGGDVGKYTGFYYTASMAAQTVTPMLSGVFMEIKMTSLFVYATIMVFAAIITMSLVKHGDSRPSDLKKTEAAE